MITCDWQILGVQCLLPRSSVAREVMSIEAEVLSGVLRLFSSSFASTFPSSMSGILLQLSHSPSGAWHLVPGQCGKVHSWSME